MPGGRSAQTSLLPAFSEYEVSNYMFASSRVEKSFDMLFNIAPQGNRLLIQPAESTGQVVVRTGIAAILSIVALLKNDSSSVSIYDVIERKQKIFAPMPQSI